MENTENKMSLLKGGDIFLLLIIIAVSYLYYTNYTISSHGKCSSYNIYHSDSLVANIKKSSDTTITINGVIISISNNRANVIESNCPNKICKNHEPISRVGQRIVCVPNRVSIIAVGNGGLDAISE